MAEKSKFFYDCRDYNVEGQRFYRQIFSYGQLKKPELPYYCYSYNVSFESARLAHFDFGIDKPFPQFSVVNRTSKVLLLHFVISGYGMINGHPVQRGTFYYLEPNIPYTIVADETKPWHLVWVAMEGEIADKWLSRLKENGQQFMSYPYPDSINSLANFFMYKSNFGETSLSFCLGLIEQFCSYIPLNKNQKDIRIVTPRMQNITSEAIKEIEKDYATLTVSKLAENAHLDRVYFTRTFKAVAGISPREYLSRFRLNVVKQYLLNTDMTIGEIVEAVGYQHRNGLESAFLQQFGCSPKAFREYYMDSDVTPIK